jgi:streptogramin lyase
MRVIVSAVAGAVIGFLISLLYAGGSVATGEPAQPGAGFAAIPGTVGGQDMSGPYEVVAGWPKDISTLPGHDKWTWGAAQGVFAESPNRVYLLFRGELPVLPRPAVRLLPEVGPSIQFPINRLPWRDATQSSLPGPGTAGIEPEESARLWKGTVGIDARWEHLLTIVDANGNQIDSWPQWDRLIKNPHSITMNPYDPEKHVWVMDDHAHVLHKFSNDGKQLVQTIGTPGQKGADATHFNRATFVTWLPDSTMLVSDGYHGTRIAKFDKDGKFLMQWGQPGTPPNETRPGYFNNVHGVAVDPQSRRVFVNDRANRRIQVFDENGTYLHEWSIGQPPAEIHLIYIGQDRNVWVYDRATAKMLQYDQDGHLLYAWGTWGDFPGAFWGAHGISVDQESNLYLSDVDTGRAQKFRPRPGANPAFLVSKPFFSAW